MGELKRLASVNTYRGGDHSTTDLLLHHCIVTWWRIELSDNLINSDNLNFQRGSSRLTVCGLIFYFLQINKVDFYRFFK